MRPAIILEIPKVKDGARRVLKLAIISAFCFSQNNLNRHSNTNSIQILYYQYHIIQIIFGYFAFLN